MSCQHEFPEDRPRTVSVREHRDESRRASDIMDAKLGRVLNRAGWHLPGSRYQHELACRAFADVSGQLYVPILTGTDPGYDFADGTDVKSAVRPKGDWYPRPLLIVNLDQLDAHAGVTARYACVAVNLTSLLARVVLVMPYEEFRRVSFPAGEAGTKAEYRQVDANHHRADLARTAPAVCMICCAEKVRGDGARTLFDPPAAPVAEPQLKRFGSVARLEDARDHIAAMRRTLKGE